MQDTPVPSFFADLSAEERAALFTDEHLRTLPAAFAAIPDPRKRRGQHYDLPFLLTCLAAALLCDCNSLEAVGRWTRDQRTVLARVCGPRRHLTPTGSLYRRLLPRLCVASVERALASWVQQTRPLRDREPLAPPPPPPQRLPAHLFPVPRHRPDRPPRPHRPHHRDNDDGDGLSHHRAHAPPGRSCPPAHAHPRPLERGEPALAARYDLR